MTTATITPAKAVTTPAKGKGRAVTKADTAELAKDAAAAVATIRAEWAAADMSAAKADTVWAAAQVAVENVRVVRSRIAYRAAMVSPVKGEPNLTRAAIILMSTAYGTPAADNKAKAAKKSVEGYVKAGTALAKAECAERITTPDESEREIVAAAFKAHNNLEKKAKAAADKAAKEAAAAAKAAAESKGKSEPGESDGGESKADEHALTFAALLAHVARMNGTADMLIKSGIPVSESDMSTLAKALDDLQIKLAVHAG